jgi:hypothetical protein
MREREEVGIIETPSVLERSIIILDFPDAINISLRKD